MKPLLHSKNSVKRYGGNIDDYIQIHDFFDSTKAAYPNIKHRCILHNSFGIFLAERVFGTYITNSDNKKVSVRDIGEDHVIEDLGHIPTIEKWLQNMEIEHWMNPIKQKEYVEKTKIKVDYND